MKHVIRLAILGVVGVGLVVGPGYAQDSTRGSTRADHQFVLDASAAGLAEVNLAFVAVRQASSAEVKQYARHMIEDHTRANSELLALANKNGLSAARTMDAEHQALEAKLLKLAGNDFDRAYMDAQVADHRKAVALFEKEATGGTDADLKAWAAKKLPTLREHLMTAQKIQAGLKAKSTEKKGR